MSELAGKRVLLINDDGIEAPGIRLLESLVREHTDDVWVIAPDEERSGASHSLSITSPVRVRRIDERRYAIKGTPTDCALLAVHELLTDRKPDVLLSGINRGANLAEDLTYSGTAAAAMEGTMLGIRSIAMSQVMALDKQPYWETARRYTMPVLDYILGCEWDYGAFVNVNFPDNPPDEVSGYRVTIQGQRPPGAFLPERRIDGRGVPYYWIVLDYPEGNALPDTDLEAIANGAVSITPLHLDFTAHSFRRHLLMRMREHPLPDPGKAAHT